MACGVAALVAALTTYDSLRWSQQTYYEAAHFPHVFVSLKRAPAALTAHLAALPGVIDVEPRVVFDVMLDVAGVAAPPIGRMIALPEHGAPRMNRLHLRQGRWVEPGHGNEVLVSEGFARVHQLRPGSRVRALLNGKYQVFEIAGVVLTPEYIFAIRSGGLLPDDRQFGVFWIAHTTLAAAFNMEGAFNDVVLRLAPGTRVPSVLEALDQLLAPYGSLGAYSRSEQMSHRFISDEIAQQGLMATTIPPVFLGVAAFLLHVVLTRVVATQREQIATLKALGYDNVTIGLHYLKLVTVITLLGIAAGITLGTWFGREMTRSYVMFFRFPVLTFRVTPWIPLLATGVSLVAAIFAAYGGVRRVVALAPAEAMRPPVPPVYRRSLLERLGLGQWLSPPGRMVLRNMARRPLRALLTTCGMALAVPLILLALFWRDAFAYMITVQFSAVDRSDARVSFTDPVAIRAQRELARIPGVMYTEAFRSVPVRLRAGHRTYRTGILGLPHDGRLHRLMDTALHPIPIPPEGVLLTDRLGERLGVQVGDSLTVEVLEGERPRRNVVVVGLVNDLVGMSAYMDRTALNRLMREGETISTVALTIDGTRADEIYAQLKQLPKVATVSIKRTALKSFTETTATFVLVFTGILTGFAIIIAVGVVYNNARIALAERAWELASWRVLGATRQEVSRVLLAELTLEILLAIPLGLWLGHLAVVALAQAHVTEDFKIPPIIAPRTYALAAFAILLAGVASAWVVQRRIKQLDLVSVLKTRE